MRRNQDHHLLWNDQPIFGFWVISSLFVAFSLPFSLSFFTVIQRESDRNVPSESSSLLQLCFLTNHSRDCWLGSPKFKYKMKKVPGFFHFSFLSRICLMLWEEPQPFRAASGRRPDCLTHSPDGLPPSYSVSVESLVVLTPSSPV